MAIFEYQGKLFGFLTDDGKVLCLDCYEKEANDGRATKILRALGTKDSENQGENDFVYVCDGHKCNAHSQE